MYCFIGSYIGCLENTFPCVPEGAIYLVLRRAQAVGTLDPKANARALARFYLGIAKGITVLHKVSGDASSLRDIVKIAMSKWPYPQGKRTGASKRDVRV